MGTVTRISRLLRVSVDDVVSRTTPTRWEQALARLSPRDRESINTDSSFQNTTTLAVLHGFVLEIEKNKEEFQDRQWKYKDDLGKDIVVRDRMNALIVNLNIYAAVADPVLQPSPSVVSLAWGGFKTLLQVYPGLPVVRNHTNRHIQIVTMDMENTLIALESLDSLARIFGHCAIYEKLYDQEESKSLDSFLSLNDALIDLYVRILEYLCYLKQHPGHNTAGE